MSTIKKISNLGRKTDKTPEVVKKLEEILRIDGTVTEACAYANISRTSYYHWLNTDSAFSNKMEDAQQYVFIEARQMINKAIKNGDSRLAFDLMRKRDKRYSDKTESQVTGHISLSDLHNNED